MVKLMKLNSIKHWMTVGMAAFAVSTVYGDGTDQPPVAVRAAEPVAAPAKPEQYYTGTVVSVDPKERVLCVRQWALSAKAFNLGDNCAYALLFTTVANNHGQINDLRPGEKVTVRYQNLEGVRIADRVEQRPVRCEGKVVALDPNRHLLTLHARGWDQEWTIGTDCIVMRRGGKPGSLADLHPGDHVTVTYETPAGRRTAREIAQTSLTFVGTLTAIDLGDKTVKARGLLGTKKFNVADDCAVVINGNLNGKLSDLKPNDKLVFNFDEINGVNVVNRIGLAAAEPQPKKNMMILSPTYPGYGY